MDPTTLKISNLQSTPIETIIDCFAESFKDYFVPIPGDVSYWKNRFYNARVDYSHSWGVFDNEKLVAFIVNAIDFEKGELTAYNTGTGVLYDYRGNKLVDKMYAYGKPHLKDLGVKRCSLEVIVENAPAIRVYTRIGFDIVRQLNCYSGKYSASRPISIKEIGLEDLDLESKDPIYSWDNRKKTIARAEDMYKVYLVLDRDSPIGHFIINPLNGNIAQLESYHNSWSPIFNGISQVSDKIKMNNVDTARTGLIEFLKHSSLENTINQYEMEMGL